MDKISTHDAEEDACNADIQVWVDGALEHRDQAGVSVYDSGFMLGDGAWEGLRLYDGRRTFLDEHVIRLLDAAKAVDLCHANDIPCRKRNFSLVDAYPADEAFLTGTFGAQTPVGSIDGRTTTGTGDIGPVTTRLRALDKAVVTP